MIVLLFGISNVGKTVTGRMLADKLQYSFFDLDEEIKRSLQTTLEKFMKDYPFQRERYIIKGRILKALVQQYKDNIVIAVSPIYHARNFNSLLSMKEVIAIELQDSAEHIFQRLVFSDEFDNVYEDNEYKERHRDYYLRDIQEDINYARTPFEKIQIKYFIDNRTVTQVVEDLLVMVQDRYAATDA